MVVVHDLLGQQAPGLTGRLTRWLRRHVEAAIRRPRLNWQWDLTLTAWMLEQAGAPRRAASEGQEFEDVIAAIGIDAQARRQGPFSTWQRGEEACVPGVMVAGALVDDPDDVRFSFA